MADDKLRATAVEVLTEYMGIAAEFVVDDAFDEVNKNAAFSSNPDTRAMYFYVCLGKQLPPEVPYFKVKEAIVKAMKA
jgi:hypothetical protein